MSEGYKIIIWMMAGMLFTSHVFLIIDGYNINELKARVTELEQAK